MACTACVPVRHLRSFARFSGAPLQWTDRDTYASKSLLAFALLIAALNLIRIFFKFGDAFEALGT
jgi:hypothetical protein